MKIAHIADTHIRLYKRHDEYREVFKKLYQSLREHKVDRIALLGDIFHSKSILSPEAVELAAEFFLELAKISPVDIIIGNHDVNIKNDTRLDAISPIVELVNASNIKIYRESGFYTIQESIWYGIFSCLDEQNFPMMSVSFEKYLASTTKKLKPRPETLIALFHGNLTGSFAENMYQFENTGYDADILFKNYDMVLLGDIHKRQEIKCNQIVEEIVDENQLELLKSKYPDLTILEEIE